MTTERVAQISRKALADALRAWLVAGLSGVTVYDGEVDPRPPVIQKNGHPDQSGRVAPYVVVYPSPGTPSDEADVADTYVDLVWTVQLTLAAGYSADLLNLIDRVDFLVYRWSPTFEGLATGRLRPPPGFDPGPIRRDDARTPPRSWVPLQYVLQVTT